MDTLTSTVSGTEFPLQTLYLVERERISRRWREESFVVGGEGNTRQWKGIHFSIKLIALIIPGWQCSSVKFLTSEEKQACFTQSCPTWFLTLLISLRVTVSSWPAEEPCNPWNEVETWKWPEAQLCGFHRTEMCMNLPDKTSTLLLQVFRQRQQQPVAPQAWSSKVKSTLIATW